MIDLPTRPTFIQSIEAMELLDKQTLSSGIQHLQISRKSYVKLKDFRIDTISDLVRVSGDFVHGRPQSCGAVGLKIHWEKIELDIRPQVIQFASSIRNGKADWTLFWEAINYEFTFAAARLDQIIQLDDETRNIRVNTLNLGKAVFLIEANSILNVGDLVDRLAEGIPDYKGFGVNKIISLAHGLRELIAKVNIDGRRSSISDPFIPSVTNPKYRGPLQYTAINRKKLSVTTANLTLGQIHLHNEIEILKKLGVQNLSQLMAVFARGIPEIKGFGEKRRTNLLKIMVAADSAISESGEMDWDAFAKKAGFHTIPNSDVPLSTGTEFLLSLEGVVQELTSRHFDEVETATLVDRLIPLKRDTVTLEEVGRRFGLTRERIRQKQKEILEHISSGVLENYYEGLSFRFTQRFSEFWRTAAEYFRGTDSVSYNDFIDGLTKSWNVKRQQIIPHLPIIYAILTKNPKMPLEFSKSGILPSKIYDISDTHDLAKPFTSLHPAKSVAESIEKAGVNTIEQMLDPLRVNCSNISHHTIVRLTAEILDPLSRVITDHGKIAWQEFYEIKGILCIPEIESESPRFFVEHAIDTVATFIEYTEITGRSAEIFRLRTVPKSVDRKTLEQTAKLLGGKGSGIKREETVLLKRIHDAIFEEDYTAAGVRFRDSFIKHWKSAQRIYQQDSSQDNFAASLSTEWKLPVSEVGKIIPMIICIIENKPKGYTGKRYLSKSPPPESRNLISEPSQPLSVIKLRGFRTDQLS